LDFEGESSRRCGSWKRMVERVAQARWNIESDCRESQPESVGDSLNIQLANMPPKESDFSDGENVKYRTFYQRRITVRTEFFENGSASRSFTEAIKIDSGAPPLNHGCYSAGARSLYRAQERIRTRHSSS